jgi:hypothetical protein
LSLAPALFIPEGPRMPEIRFEAKAETLSVLDGYCSARGKCRTAVIGDLLEQWAQEKLHEAIVICRVAGANPTAPESDRK